MRTSADHFRIAILRFLNNGSRLSWLDLGISVAVRIFQFVLLCLALLASATLVYTVLYALLIPKQHLRSEIFFDYGAHSDLDDVYRGTSEAMGLSFRTLPRATLNLLSKHAMWNGTNLSDEGAHKRSARVLTPAQAYDIMLLLDVADSNANRDLGMFMAFTELRTGEGELLARSARPMALRSEPTLVVMARTALWAWPLALGWIDSTQRLALTCFDSYVEMFDNPLGAVSVVLSHPKVQVSRATLLITARLEGIRHLMVNYFVASAAIGIVNIAFAQGLLLLLIYLWSSDEPQEANLVWQDRSMRGNGELDSTEEESERPVIDFDDLDERMDEHKSDTQHAVGLRERQGYRARDS